MDATFALPLGVLKVEVSDAKIKTKITSSKKIINHCGTLSRCDNDDGESPKSAPKDETPTRK